MIAIVSHLCCNIFNSNPPSKELRDLGRTPLMTSLLLVWKPSGVTGDEVRGSTDIPTAILQLPRW